MIWFSMFPIILFFTFENLIGLDWLSIGEPQEWPFLAWVFTIFTGFFLSGLIFLVPFGIGCWIGSIPQTVGVPDQSYPLVTLREKDGIHGQFFLGTGTLNDVEYYFWYRRVGDVIQGGRTPRDPGVRIREIETNETPRMQTFKTAYTNPLFNSFWWGLVAIDVRGAEDWYPDFYIPKGSIQEGYSL